MAEEQVSTVDPPGVVRATGWRAIFPPVQWLSNYQLRW
ncbi:hypothetical protein SAMN05192539_10201, partial [Paraburkholderia diazotrophica]